MNNQMTKWGLDDKDIMWWRCPTHMEVNPHRECSQCDKELKKINKNKHPEVI